MRYGFKGMTMGALAVCAALTAGGCANTTGSSAAAADAATTFDIPSTPKDTVTAGDSAGIDIAKVDIQTAGTEKSISDIQKSDPSQKCANTSGFTNVLKGVKISGAIVVSPVNKSTTSAGKTREGVWVQTKGGGAWTGIYLETDEGATSIGSLKVGDTITAVGDIVEYYCFTELQPAVVTIETAAAELPAAVTVDIAQLGDKATDGDNESFESVLVTVNNVVLSNEAALGTDGKPHGELYVGPDDKTDALRIGPMFGVYLTDKAGTVYTSKWPKGTKFASITGVMQFSFGKFRLLPVSAASIVVAK